MSTKIVVNLPVKDLPTSMAFFRALAFDFDAQFTNDAAACLVIASRAKVDEMVSKALRAGGSAHTAPQDHGFMYQHSFQHPDGHIWEPFYMDPNAGKK